MVVRFDSGIQVGGLVKHRWQVWPGTILDYAEFCKEGNFLPMSVLDPDIGMDTEIFAQQRKGSLSGRLSEMSGYNGEPVNVDEAFDKVTEIFQDKKLLVVQKHQSVEQANLIIRKQKLNKI